MAIDVRGLRPGAYSELIYTLTNPIIPATLRFPMVVGCADEVLNVPAVELSRYGIQHIEKYDLSSLVDGVSKTFTVPSTYTPIISQSNRQLLASKPTDIVVYADGKKKQVKALYQVGSAWKFDLYDLLPLGSILQISLDFDDADKVQVDSLVAQADGVATKFYVSKLFVVDGSGRGIITNDPKAISVLVNGSAVEVIALDGAAGTFTTRLPVPSSPTTFTATYFNAFPRSYDYLPEHNRVVTVNSVGTRPGAADYIQGTQYLVKSSDGFKIIVWGSSVLTQDVVKGSGSVGIDSLLNAAVKDELIVNEELSPVDWVAKTGRTAYAIKNGQNLDQNTADPALLVGVIESATGFVSASTPISAIYIDSQNRTIKANTSLSGAVGNKLFASYYSNLIAESLFTIEVLTVGAVGVGTYKVMDSLGATVMRSYEGTHTIAFAGLVPEYPNGVRDLRATPGASVAGVYDLTFTSATAYSVVFTPTVGAPVAVGNGFIDQTFKDNTRGVKWTLVTPSAGAYAAADIVQFKVDATARTASAQPVLDIPGVQFVLNTTVGTVVGDRTTLNTYNLENVIPPGTFYYVAYTLEKTTLEQPVFLSRADFLANNIPVFLGAKTTQNLGVLGVEAAFSAGAPFVCFLQTKKNASGFSGVTEFEACRKVWEQGFENKLNPYYIVPMTVNESILQSYKTTVVQLSSYRYGRECDLQRSVDPALSFREAMDIVGGFRTVRCQLWFPGDPIIDFVDASGNTEEFQVDGSVVAAVIAGLRTSGAYKVSESLVGGTKVIPYIKRMQTTLYEPFYGELDQASISILINEDNVVKVWNESSTDNEQVKTKEPTVLFCVDKLAIESRKSVKPQAGQIANDTAGVEKVMVTVLNTNIFDGTITDYKDLSVVKDAIDTRITRVKVTVFVPEIQKWITITFNV